MILRIMLILLVLIKPIGLYALGLGRLELESALNEKFQAKIELLSVTAEDLASLEVRLADLQAFKLANIELKPYLHSLHFKVENSEKGAYIRIRSNKIMRELFLHFLVDANWSNGRLLRDYAIVLDPPGDNFISAREVPVQSRKQRQKTASIVQKPPREVPVQSRKQRQKTASIVQDIPKEVPVQSRKQQQKTASIVQDIPKELAVGNSYGPVVRGDTLWAIAQRARAGSSISIQQMMVAILHMNSGAFVANNINGLKQGVILQLPDLSTANFLQQKNAISQVKQQNQLWDMR